MRLRRCRQPLALAITIALALPGAALAQTAKERELEARIAQLEAQVQALLQAQQQTRETVEETRSRLDAVQVASAPADDGKPRIQSTSILPAGNPGASFSYGGFIKLDAMATDTSDGVIAEGSAGRLFYVPSTIPVVADGAEPDADPYTDIHAAFSRFWLAADWTSDGGDKFRAYIEADMYGGGSANLGNEVSTNTHGITVRHAYVTWNRWLAGQTWTNFQDVAALPDTVDFIGVTDGTIFVRQAQVRYTNGPFSVSLENPHTTVSDVATAARNNAGGSDLFPDLTARYVFKGDWGHFSVAGLLRQLKSGDETDTGFAVSLSGRFNIGGLRHRPLPRPRHRPRRRARRQRQPARPGRRRRLRRLAARVRAQAARQPDVLVRAVRQRPWPPRLGTGQLRRGREHPLRPRQPDLLAVPEAGHRRRGQLGRTRARG